MSAKNTYTFTQKTELTEPGQESNFGGLVNDANHNVMTGFTGNGPQTVDISGTPLSSPQTVSATNPMTLTTPLNATVLNVYVTTHTITFSESDATVSSGFTIPVNTFLSIPVARVAALYFLATSTGAILNFWYDII